MTPADIDITVPSGFTVRRELGRGARTVVWLARHDVTGREVALKVWSRPLRDEAARARFLDECRWHELLSGHPHIVEWVWASQPDAPNPWTATKPHGESLARWLRRPRPLAQRLQVACDLLEGLAAMHRRDLLHRDINPNNVLVDDAGRAALCDLGIALPCQRQTRDMLAGTPGFLAPEQQSDGEHPSLQTDVYAAARTLEALLDEDSPVQLRQVLTRAGSVRPQDRPADAAEFVQALRAGIEEAGLPLTTPSPPDPPEPARRSWRHRRTLLLTAVLVPLLAGAAWGLPQLVGPPERTANPVAAVMAQEPDVAPDGSPVRRPPKASARCHPPAQHVVPVQDGSGSDIGEVRVSFDENRNACAKFVKPEGSPLHGQSSYLALSLCNEAGVCDHDWNDFRIDAGPVKLPTSSGCVHWRVSARDAPDQTWLVKDASGDIGCA